MEVAGKHFNPKPSSIAQRFRFNSCIRKEGESVAEFVAQLRQLSEHCQFGDTLNDMLRDRIVCGINDQRIQRRLLAESDFNLNVLNPCSGFAACNNFGSLLRMLTWLLCFTVIVQ